MILISDRHVTKVIFLSGISVSYDKAPRLGSVPGANLVQAFAKTWVMHLYL